MAVDVKGFGTCSLLKQESHKFYDTTLNCIVQGSSLFTVSLKAVNTSLLKFVVNSLHMLSWATLSILAEDMEKILSFGILCLNNRVFSTFLDKSNDKLKLLFVKSILHGQHQVVALI